MAEVEPAAADDRVGPGGAFAAFGDLELADQLVARRRRPDQADLAVFAQGVEHAVGEGERALAHAPLGIHLPAGLPVEADPFGVVVEVAAP